MTAKGNLSLLVALWTAMVITALMAGYAVVQYFFLMPGITVAELFVQHLWHVLVLGAAIYFTCWLVFRRVLLQPLNRICMHLYGIGEGTLDPLTVNSRVVEIRMIVDWINLMIWRLGRKVDSQVHLALKDQLGELEAWARHFGAKDPDTVGEFRVCLGKLEHQITRLVQEYSDTRHTGLDHPVPPPATPDTVEPGHSPSASDKLVA